MEIFELYKTTILMVGLMGLILIIQLLVVDMIAIKQKHTPGFPVEPNHDSSLFRSVRAQSNTNESISIFILLVIFGILSSADPEWLNNFSIAYFVGRVGHMFFYYLGIGLARSIAFSVSLIALLGMLITSFLVWI